MREQQIYQEMMNEVHASENLKEKIHSLYEEHSEERRQNGGRVFRIALAAAFSCFLISNVVSLAATGQIWLTKMFYQKEDFVSDGEKTKVKNEVRIDVKNGKNELVANKESMTRDGNTVTFYSQIDITEWDYWNYMKEYALKDELIFPKVSSVIPDEFSYKKEDSDTSYMLIEGLDKELNRTDSMLQEAEDGKSAGVKFHIIVTDSEAENGIIAGDSGEKQINSKEAMRFDVQKVWSGEKGEICYRERVNPYMKQETYKDVKDIEETTIDGNRAYLIKKENGCVCARIYKKARIVTISIDIGSEKKAMKLLEQIVGEK